MPEIIRMIASQFTDVVEYGAGDIAGAMPRAAVKWAALPKGPGLEGGHPGQPFVTYEEFFRNYQAAEGTGK